MSARARGLRRGVALAALALAAALVLALAATAPTLTLHMMTPSAPFDANASPPPPDYRDDRAWLALPTTADDADVALPELPATRAPAADVFYLHPTSSVAPVWNARADDPVVRTASVRGGTLIQASAFNGSGAVFAPSYRQASGVAFTAPSPDGERAIDVAFADVDAAFTDFERRTGGARPFILVGHSQGAALGARLLRERIVHGPARARLVAAYLPGALVSSRDVGGLPACAAREATGCVITYNARGPTWQPSAFDLDASVTPEPHLCVNPVLGRAGDDATASGQHGGAVFFDVARPALVPGFAAARCHDGVLVVTELQPLPWRGAPSAVLRWVMGRQNHHPVEVQLFYADLRADAARRVAAFVAAPAPH